MKKTYQILSINHSGRKDIRGTPVTDNKYDYMVGSDVVFDIKELRIGESFTFWFIKHPFYKYWNTSTVNCIVNNTEKKTIQVETYNSIYKFKEVGDIKIERRPDSIILGELLTSLA